MNNKPVAWMSQGGDVSRSADYFVEMGFTDLIPLYTHPVKELTDEEIEELIWNTTDMKDFARAILRKAQEKLKVLERIANERCNGFCGEYECKENQSRCKRKVQAK